MMRRLQRRAGVKLDLTWMPRAGTVGTGVCLLVPMQVLTVGCLLLTGTGTAGTVRRFADVNTLNKIGGRRGAAVLLMAVRSVLAGEVHA
jgi:hypothetical protein